MKTFLDFLAFISWDTYFICEKIAVRGHLKCVIFIFLKISWPVKCCSLEMILWLRCFRKIFGLKIVTQLHPHTKIHSIWKIQLTPKWTTIHIRCKKAENRHFLSDETIEIVEYTGNRTQNDKSSVEIRKIIITKFKNLSNTKPNKLLILCGLSFFFSCSAWDCVLRRHQWCVRVCVFWSVSTTIRKLRWSFHKYIPRKFRISNANGWQIRTRHNFWMKNGTWRWLWCLELKPLKP